MKLKETGEAKEAPVMSSPEPPKRESMHFVGWNCRGEYIKRETAGGDQRAVGAAP